MEFKIALQLIFSFVAMCFVLVLSYVATKWLGKKLSFKTNSSHMKIIDKLYVDRDKVIVIVKIANQNKVIAMSSNAITDLGEIGDVDDEEESPKSMEFQDMLLKMQDVWKAQKGKQRNHIKKNSIPSDSFQTKEDQEDEYGLRKNYDNK